MEKQCFKCQQTKPLDAFYKHFMMADGHLNKCKECTKTDVKKHRKENDSVREYDRWRYHNQPLRKEFTRAVSESWNANNPLAYKAHNAVSNAIRDGKLVRQKCEACDNPGHAHHEDYTKPFEIRWLCPLHHSRLHAS